MATAFIITGIEWPSEAGGLPSSATIPIGNYLADLGFEDFEPDQRPFNRIATKSQKAQDKFWDSYQPSDEAMSAYDAEWDIEVKSRLKSAFGVVPLSYENRKPE